VPLLLAGVPIGQTGDASPRLRSALATADVIAAEDTRRLTRLCRDLGVTYTGRLVSYFDGNETERAPQLLQALRTGETVLLVTDNTLPLQIVGLIQASAIRPDLYALGTATTLVTLALIFGVLIAVSVRLRLRGRRVERVEEELGLEGAIDAEAAALAGLTS